MGVLTNRAKDIDLNAQELCEAMGYLATPGRMLRIEAQVPYGKEAIFQKEYPGQEFYHMLESSDKQSFQLRIMLNSTKNCPRFLASEISAGGGSLSAGCISRGKFVERIVKEYGFRFTVDTQDVSAIRQCVQARYPQHVLDFERGYNTPL